MLVPLSSPCTSVAAKEPSRLQSSFHLREFIDQFRNGTNTVMELVKDFGHAHLLKEVNVVDEFRSWPRCVPQSCSRSVLSDEQVGPQDDIESCGIVARAFRGRPPDVY